MNLYEARLRSLYTKLLDAFEGHKHHTSDGSSCPQQVWCDRFAEIVDTGIDDAFPVEDAGLFIMDGPPDLLDWTTGGEFVFDSARETIAAALRYDAWHQRLFPTSDRRPQDPDFTFSGPCPACGIDVRDETPCEECGDGSLEPRR